MTQPQMSQFQFVRLVEGPKKIKMSADEAARMQKGHLVNLKILLDRGTAIALGPVPEGGDLRGVVILKVKDAEAAKALFRDDPLVSSEQLAVDTLTWNSQGNPFGTRSAGIMDLEPCWIGFLSRPAQPPQFSEDELKKMQTEHIGNIVAMHTSGELFGAGPMSENTPLRGLLFFRDVPEKKIKELVARDPMVKKKRLELKLVKWLVPKGLVPPKPTQASGV